MLAQQTTAKKSAQRSGIPKIRTQESNEQLDERLWLELSGTMVRERHIARFQTQEPERQ